MRGRASLAGLFLCLSFAGAGAQATYRLQPGDTLQVWIAQEPELAREVVIAPDGWLSFPLAGHLQGAGLSVSQLEAQLLDRLKQYFNDTPNLTIMLRPNPQHQQLIYVTGEVVTPGEYPYRADMTVLHGVSVAGGLYRTTLLAADQDRSVLVQREIEHATKHLAELKARTLRLQAELRGDTKLATPEQMAADPMLAQEQSLMDSRREALEVEDKAQRQAKELAERNFNAMREQSDTVSKRVDLAKRRLQSISTLVAKGGAESSQAMVQEGVVAELEGQISRLMSEMAVAERTKIAEDARYDTTRQERHTQLLMELNATRRDQEDTEARLGDSTRIMSIYDQNRSATQQRQTREIAYHIIRAVDGKTTEVEASETTPIMAGDLVRVFYRNPGEARAAEAAPEPPENAASAGMTEAAVQ